MKIVVLIVRLLLGLVFLVFGLNAFLQFLKGLYLAASRTVSSGSIPVALWVGDGAVQAVGGALLLINRYVPLADDSWAGDRKYFALPSAAQSRRHGAR